MSSLIEKVKEWYSTILGLLLMTTAITGYKFNIPFDLNTGFALGEFALGLILVFLDPRKIALEAWEVIKSKL